VERPELLLLAGGIRAGSLNEKLIGCAALAAGERGLRVTRLSLADYRLPLFGAEALRIDDVPEAMALKAMFSRHDAVIIASPEHNGSVTAMLKNALDWISCPEEGEAAQAYGAFRRKPFALLSASSSPFGGLRGLSQLRHILTTVKAWVVPEQLSVPHAHRAFDAADKLIDPFLQTLLDELIEAVATAVRR
jgi:chromate reductase, NAD(P)H dehydrogenase (quinone)